jgi:hypothetical protein
MGTARNMFLAQMAKRGLRGAGGFAKRGIRGGAGRVANALEMQQLRRRQAERGLSRVGAESFESKNIRVINERERRRMRSKLNAEYNSVRKVYKADLDVIKKNINRVIAENNLRIKVDPVVIDLLSINLLKKTTELRQQGVLPKPPGAKKAMDLYITNALRDLKGRLSFVRGRRASTLTLEINNEIATSLNELANPQ